MITVDPPVAFGHTIFCDDIRFEVGGKLTYVGAYAQGKMFVHSPFPVVLPKLCLGISYFQKATEVILPTKFMVFLPGDTEDKPSITSEPTEKDARQALAAAHDLAIKLKIEIGLAHIHTQIVIAPLNLTQEGVIRVRAVRGDELIRLGGISVCRPLQPSNET
jgi:hypothetical protein